MTKQLYRKRPIRVRAEQFIPENLPWPEGVYVAGNYFFYDQIDPNGPEKTVIYPGDWIVEVHKKDAWGEEWRVVTRCVDNEEFEYFYELADETPVASV